MVGKSELSVSPRELTVSNGENSMFEINNPTLSKYKYNIVLPNGVKADQLIGEISEQSRLSFTVETAGFVGSTNITVKYEKVGNIKKSGKIQLKLTSESNVAEVNAAGLSCENVWADYRAGDDWPTEQKVQALGKTLDTIDGENPEQFVALWFQGGEPVLGRMWNEDGKIAANFGWGGNEYNENIGSIQVLACRSDRFRGFDYDWKPFREAARLKEWTPVYVTHPKGDISPAVVTVNGKQILGMADVCNNRASVSFDGKEHLLVGPDVNSAMVLCRKAKPGCTLE